MERSDLTPYVDRMEELQRQIVRHFQHRVESQGCISPSQYCLMRVLEAEAPLTVSDLAERLDMTAAGATGLIDRMVKAGWLDRRRDVEDRRVVHVALTEEGKERLREASALRRSIMADFLAPLTRAEVEQLVSLYAKAMAGLGCPVETKE